MEKIIKFLNENSIMALATSFKDKPRASTMEYIMVGDSIIFATSPESIKANNLKHNNLVSISIHNMPRFVTIDGHVTDATPAEIQEFNKVLFERHSEFKEMVDNGLVKPFAYFKICLKEIYYSDYTTGQSIAEVLTF